MRIFLIAFILVLLISPVIASQEVSLDHLDGYNNVALVADGSTVNVLHIKISTGASAYGGITGGFRFYSETGAEWGGTNIDTMSWGWNDWFDLNFALLYYDTDGLGADTLGFVAARLSAEGIPAGFNDVAFMLEVGPIDPMYHDGSLTLDSSFCPTSSFWKWASPTVIPDWGGPYTFRIVDPSQCTGLDLDNDNYPEGCDNCPTIYNPNQDDEDSDGAGDECDNCPGLSNPSQADYDNDGIGDECDVCTDTDGDGYGDPGFPANTCPEDNCPDTYNPSQADNDGDGFPDACDNCPDVYNDQTDSDSDGIGDGCDECPLDPDNDIDNDGYCANEDNCPEDYNPDQADDDQNGVGNVCEGCCMGEIRGNVNYDPQDQIDISDLMFLVEYMFEGLHYPLPCEEEADINETGSVDISDMVILLMYMFFPPDDIPYYPLNLHPCN